MSLIVETEKATEDLGEIFGGLDDRFFVWMALAISEKSPLCVKSLPRAFEKLLFRELAAETGAAAVPDEVANQEEVCYAAEDLGGL